MNYEFDFGFLLTRWPEFIEGAILTFGMTLVSIVLGLISGTAMAFVRVYGAPWSKKAVGWYVNFFRNTPLVVQAFWVYFGLATVQIYLPAMAAAIVTLAVNSTAYVTEIMRAGIESTPRGQLEAAESLGLTRKQMMWYVILPQATAKMYPSLVGQVILVLLGSSIMSQISAEELTAVGYRVQSETFRGFEIYIVIAIVYLVLSWLLRLLFELGAKATFLKRWAPKPYPRY